MGKGRGRHIVVNKNDMPNWSETLESFRTARESWDLLHSHDGLEAGRRFLCSVILSLHQKLVIRTAALIVHKFFPFYLLLCNHNLIISLFLPFY